MDVNLFPDLWQIHIRLIYVYVLVKCKVDIIFILLIALKTITHSLNRIHEAKQSRTHPTVSMMQWLECSSQARYIMASGSDRVKPKTINLVFAAFPLSTLR